MKEQGKEFAFSSLLLHPIEYPASQKNAAEKAFYTSQVKYRSIWHRVESPTSPREVGDTSTRLVTSMLIISGVGFQSNIFPQTFYSQLS